MHAVAAKHGCRVSRKCTGGFVAVFAEETQMGAQEIHFWCVLASDTRDTQARWHRSSMYVMRADTGMWLSMPSAQLSGVGVSFFSLGAVLAGLRRTAPSLLRGVRLKKKRGGNGGISPPPLPPCLARKQKLWYNGVQPPAVLTPGTLRCYDTGHVRCRPPSRWPNSLQRQVCWDAVEFSHSLPLLGTLDIRAMHRVCGVRGSTPARNPRKRPPAPISSQSTPPIRASCPRFATPESHVLNSHRLFLLSAASVGRYCSSSSPRMTIPVSWVGLLRHQKSPISSLF